MAIQSPLRNFAKFFFFGAPLRSTRTLFRPLARKVLGERRLLELYYLVYTSFSPNAGYSREYYEEIDHANRYCYELLAEVLTTKFHPKALVDVGCGSGGISQAFKNAGCATIHSFDNSENALTFARSRGLGSVRQLDLTKTEEIPAKGDLCVCLEVAEHLPSRYADRLCRLLSDVAPVLAFTAAPPGQGGHLHVNEQPQEYWVERFKKIGMAYDGGEVKDIRQRFNGKMLRDYDDNLMIFKRA